jgi:hypothetical protein
VLWHIGQAGVLVAVRPAGRPDGEAPGAVTLDLDTPGGIYGIQNFVPSLGGLPRRGAIAYFLLSALPNLVRTGLAVVGVALLVVGAATVLLLLTIPPSNETTLTSLGATLGPFSYSSAPLTMQNTSQGSLTISWSSNEPISVEIFHPAKPCTGGAGCALGNPVGQWNDSHSGSWTLTGSLVFPFIVNVTNSGSTTAAFHGLATESYTSSAPLLPTTTELFVLTSGVVLAIIGGLALFLGLFLRGGVYREPPPVPHRSADDLEEYSLEPGWNDDDEPN